MRDDFDVAATLVKSYERSTDDRLGGRVASKGKRFCGFEADAASLLLPLSPFTAKPPTSTSS